MKRERLSVPEHEHNDETTEPIVRGPRMGNQRTAEHAAKVRRKRQAAKSSVADETDVAREGVGGAGQPVPFLGELEEQFGTDLSHVKAHMGPEAADASMALGAEAYALGDDIGFLSSDPDKQLVAHEVAHTLQNGQGSESDVEREADVAAARVASGQPVGRLRGNAGGRVRKKGLTGKWREFLADLDAKPIDGGAEADLVDLMIDGSGHHSKSVGVVTASPGGVGASLTETDTKIDREALYKHNARLEAEARERLRNDIDKSLADISAGRKKATKQLAAVERQRDALQVSLDTMNERTELDETLTAGKKAKVSKEIGKAKRSATMLKTELDWYDTLEDSYKASRKRIADKEPKAKTLISEADALEALNKKFVKEVKTKNTKLSLTMLRGFELEQSSKTVDRSVAGESEKSSSTKTQIELKDGIAGKQTRTKGSKIRDETGRVTHGRESTDTREAKIIAKQDGTTGIGAGRKLGEALESSHGKVFGEVGGDGAYTVNIVPIPRADAPAEQQFAVICTLDLSVSLGVGAEKELEHHSKEEDKTGGLREQGKAKAGVTASGSVGASFTHTRTMDGETVTKYLANLEKAGDGKETSEKLPEFTVLQKAFEALKSSDDAAGAVAAAFGSSDSASSMEPGESIEFTAKVSGEIGGTVGGGNKEDDPSKKKSASASASASASMFRTIKIGRVSGGASDQKLVEVAVAFGKSNQFAGAMSASALGVTASAGTKHWKSAEQSVVFRLDASIAEQYQPLYEDIVSTMTPGGLAKLRKSPRYQEHVLSYKFKESRGRSNEFGAKSALGLNLKTDRERGTEHELDADGNRTITETGSATHSMTGSVGPLDLFKHSRKDSATFTATSESSVLDISQETDSSVPLGGEMPGVRDVLAGPTKAIEKALLDNHKTLRGYQLDPDDLDKLVARARKNGRADEQAPWFNALHHAGVMNDESTDAKEWMKLRGRLVASKPAEGFPIEDIAMARQLGRGRAVADFMSESTKGFELLELVLRDFDKLGGDSEDIGVHTEWPPELKSTKPKYSAILRRVNELETELAPHLSNEEDGAELGSDVCADVQYELAEVIAKITGCHGFEEPIAKIEMLEELQKQRKTIVQKRRTFFRAFGDGELTDIDLARDAKADAKVDVTALEQVLHQLKAQERMALSSGEQSLADNERLIATFAGTKHYDRIKDKLDDLVELYDKWVPTVHSLRAAYITAEVPRSERMCSADTKDDGRYLDISYFRFEKLFKAWAELRVVSTYDYDALAAKRKAKYWYY